MLPGPDFVYKCPNCGNLLSKGSFMSGNTFGAKIFSDGKRIAPMLPEFPNLIKCKKCNNFLWLSKLKEIGTFEGNDKQNLKRKDTERAEFLEIKDYDNALKAGMAENKVEELTIRRIPPANYIFQMAV